MKEFYAGAVPCMPLDVRTRQRAQKVHASLVEAYPDVRCELICANPLQLLVATILSAQCTDVRVNQVTPALFRRYPAAEAFAAAELRELEKLIKSAGLYRNKARSIREACRELVEKHGGQVPKTREELVALRGVGRKTANVVLGNAFNIPAIAVDTHVGRVSRRLDFTAQTDPARVERDLMQRFAPERWTMLSHLLIRHGRTCCKAPRPRCSGCPVLKLCPYPEKNFDD